MSEDKPLLMSLLSQLSEEDIHSNQFMDMLNRMIDKENKHFKYVNKSIFLNYTFILLCASLIIFMIYTSYNLAIYSNLSFAFVIPSTIALINLYLLKGGINSSYLYMNIWESSLNRKRLLIECKKSIENKEDISKTISILNQYFGFIEMEDTE